MKITQQDYNEYIAGVSINDIAARHQIRPNTAYAQLRKYGPSNGRLKRPRLTADEKAALRAELQQGVKPAALMIRYGIKTHGELYKLAGGRNAAEVRYGNPELLKVLKTLNLALKGNTLYSPLARSRYTPEMQVMLTHEDLEALSRDPVGWIKANTERVKACYPAPEEPRPPREKSHTGLIKRFGRLSSAYALALTGHKEVEIAYSCGTHFARKALKLIREGKDIRDAFSETEQQILTYRGILK